MPVNLTAQSLNAVGSVAGGDGVWRSDDLGGGRQNSNSLLWSADFEYGASCKQDGGGGATNCNTINNDGINWDYFTPASNGGEWTEVTAGAANFGSYGYRQWAADGVNQGTSPVRYDFASPLTEFWIRWYQRYQSGFTWTGGTGGNPQYDKTIDIETGGALALFPQHSSNGNYAITIVGGGATYQVQSSPAVTWTDVFGSTSDGLFHRFEIHVKIDTDGTDGIGQFWIDDDLVADVTGVDYSNGDVNSRLGITNFVFNGNQNAPNNAGTIGSPAYIDYDGLVIYDTTPPYLDGSGNPWIGPV